MIQTAMAYELCTVASTKQGRMSLKRQGGVMPAAIFKKRRNPRGRPPDLNRIRRATITSVVRQARVMYYGHILRRPEGHHLRRAMDLDLGRRKVGRPCFNFPTSLREDLARFSAPEEGWEVLPQQKRKAARYLCRVKYA